jgi:hypothetical protein
VSSLPGITGKPFLEYSQKAGQNLVGCGRVVTPEQNRTRRNADVAGLAQI